MSLLLQSEIKALVQRDDGWHVSIYMPTHRLSDQIEQDPIRFKNLVNQSEERLVDAGLRAPEARTLLEPLRELVDSRPFWRHQSDGLAVFISPSVFRYQRLPLNFKELVVVSDRFHLKPLLPLLSGDGRFLLLTLSQQEIRLLRGSRHSIGEVDLHDIPKSLHEALRWDDPERRLQWHTSSSNEPGMRRAEFHGHMANAEMDSKEFIRRYLQIIDQGLNEILAGQRLPLVLAGVDYLLPIYHQVSAYPNLLEDGIVGSPDELDLSELHAKAWPIVAPRFQQERQEAAGRYEMLAGKDSNLASSDLDQILPAAVFERVETLFIPPDLNRWGRFDPDTAQVTHLSEPEHGADDLIDLAAVHTFLNGGRIYAVDPEEIPGEGEVAAIFRY